jgi:UDP-glucose 4-epimerase
MNFNRPSHDSETNNMLERRANSVGRAATSGVRRISLGGLRLAVLDIEQTALRFFNASGADALAEIGELRDNETHLIPRAMMALQGHLADFALFGDDYDTPDGTAICDYIHVTDLATAHVLALNHLMQGHRGGVFNLGTGIGLSVRQILTAIAAEAGRDVPYVINPRRQGDPTYLVADPGSAREALRFRPAHSDLATIIRTAWAWHRKAHPLKTATAPVSRD